ncbi:hypothetical protein RFI_09774, partial [Reticulomyxa filosa]
TVQEWKGDLMKEITALTKPNATSSYQSSWEEDSFKAIGALGVGQNEIMEKLNKILEFQKHVYQNLSKAPNAQGLAGSNGTFLRNDSVATEIQQLTQLTTKLIQDVGAVSMLSALREEYKLIREERDTLKKSVDQFRYVFFFCLNVPEIHYKSIDRKHNSELLTRVNQLEEDAIYLRESKRTTVKNMVGELNEMREKLASLSHIVKNNTPPSS